MSPNKTISPYFEYGIFAGVRCTFENEDFVITAKNYKNGKRMSWKEAMSALNADGLSTFNYRQICFTIDFRIEINKVLMDNGGEILNKHYWTRSEFMTDYAFVYDSKRNILDVFDKSCTWSVRYVKNLK